MTRSLILGTIIVSEFPRSALTEAGQDARVLLERHQGGDWGELDRIGWQLNDHAAANGLDVTSYYCLDIGVIVMITTEYERTTTHMTLLSGEKS